MKLLLDTHSFLWGLLEPERLNRDATTELSNPENQIWLSPISVWETMILAERGRVVSLQLHVDGYPRAFAYDVSSWELADDIPEQTHRMDVRITGLPSGSVYRPPVAKIPVPPETPAPFPAP